MGIDIPLFDGPTIHELIFIIGLGVAFISSTLFTLFAACGFCAFKCCMWRKKRQLLKRIREGEEYSPLEATEEEWKEMEMQKTSRVKWGLLYFVAWSWVIFTSGGIIWLVVLDYLVWYAGMLCIIPFLWIFWFFLFPFYGHPSARDPLTDSLHQSSSFFAGSSEESMAEKVEMLKLNGESSEIAQASTQTKRCAKRRCYFARLMKRAAKRVTKRPFWFLGGLLFWIVFAFLGCFIFEGICVAENPIEGNLSPLSHVSRPIQLTISLSALSSPPLLLCF